MWNTTTELGTIREMIIFIEQKDQRDKYANCNKTVVE